VGEEGRDGGGEELLAVAAAGAALLAKPPNWWVVGSLASSGATTALLLALLQPRLAAAAGGGARGISLSLLLAALACLGAALAAYVAQAGKARPAARREAAETLTTDVGADEAADAKPDVRGE